MGVRADASCGKGFCRLQGQVGRTNGGSRRSFSRTFIYAAECVLHPSRTEQLCDDLASVIEIGG